MSTSLVIGYDSDSEEDDVTKSSSNAVHVTNPEIHLSSSSQNTAPSKDIQINPIPSDRKSTKKRHQIRIESLDSIKSQDDKRNKKIKLSAAEKKPGGHTLLNLLPPPQHKNPIVPVKKAQKEGSSGDSTNDFGLTDTSSGVLFIRDASPDASQSKSKAKVNNDFRAMLGLKGSSNMKKEQPTSDAGPKVELTQPISTDHKITTQIQTEKDQNEHYFNSNTLHSDIHQSKQPHNPSFAVSSAPIIDDEDDSLLDKQQNEFQSKDDDPYSGWQQGPDGNWFPVTPEAHEKYQLYLADRAKDGVESSQHAHNFDSTNIHHMDVNLSNSNAIASSSAENDKKYALAAASISRSGQSSTEFGGEEDEERKKMDKSTNLRAKRKGQLTSLLVQAEEKRDQLEQKWAKGRSARNEARSKYGF